MKVLVVAVALVWGLWWFADVYGGPEMKTSVDYMVNEVEGVKQAVSYDKSLQREYQRSVAEPSWLPQGLVQQRRGRGTWQWWAIGLAPIGLATIFALRRTL